MTVAAVTSVVLAAIGTLLNDSGVTVAAMVTIVAFGALFGGGVPAAATADQGRAADDG
jgi:hypothetical protein